MTETSADSAFMPESIEKAETILRQINQFFIMWDAFLN